MATVVDLIRTLEATSGMGEEEIRFAVRIAQDVGVLPKAKRGGWRDMPALTPGHVADFLMLLAGTRGARNRTKDAAKEAVARFRDLRPSVEELTGTALSALEDVLRRKGQIGQWSIRYVLFINHPVVPEIEFRAWRENGDQRAWNYMDQEAEPPGDTADAFIVREDVLWGLADMLAQAPAEAIAG